MSGDDPAPHFTKANALMKRLNLADGSQEGATIAEAMDRVAELQGTPSQGGGSPA
ncbi:MAG: hypothetical protein VX127_11015 [Myxococcota bacterium]|nr:hypothetical protein [Myxococcota bacterium]